MQPFSRETLTERRQPQLRWGAVLAGVALTVGLWLTLQVLGLGLGLATIETDDAGSLKGAGILTGIWSIVASLIAMFAGAVLVGRLAGTRERKIGAMHGSVMWALALVIGLWSLMATMSSLTRGISRVGGVAVDAGSSLVSGAAGAGGEANNVLSALGVDANDLLGPINEQLRQQGKPAVTATQVEAVVKDVVQRSLRQGRFDRALLVEELAQNTALTRADAEGLATQVERRYSDGAQNLRAKVEQVGQQAKETALGAADATGKALMLAGLMMLLSLGAAVGGAALGVRHRRDRDAEATMVTPVIPPMPPSDRPGGM